MRIRAAIFHIAKRRRGTPNAPAYKKDWDPKPNKESAKNIAPTSMTVEEALRPLNLPKTYPSRKPVVLGQDMLTQRRPIPKANISLIKTPDIATASVGNQAHSEFARRIPA